MEIYKDEYGRFYYVAGETIKPVPVDDSCVAETKAPAEDISYEVVTELAADIQLFVQRAVEIKGVENKKALFELAEDLANAAQTFLNNLPEKECACGQ